MLSGDLFTPPGTFSAESMPRELLLIGIDGAVPTLIEEFYREGLLPNIGSLIEEGMFAEAIPCPPCDTPTNWTTIATGATTAVHGATSFYMHVPGEPLDLGLRHRGRAHLSKYCMAEYFWDVADRRGLTCFILNYPAGWPGALRRGAVALYSWPVPESLPRAIAPPASMTFEKDARDARLRISRAAKPPSGLMSRSPLLEFSLPVEGGHIRTPAALKAFVVDSRGMGYDSLYVVAGGRLYGVEEGSWSEWMRITLDTDYGSLECLLRVKLLEVAPDGNRVRVYRSEVLNPRGWTRPEGLGEELILNSLISLEAEEEVPYIIFGREAEYVERYVREAKSLAAIVAYMKRRIGWQVCFLHYHILDGIHHRFAAAYEGMPDASEEERERAQEAIRRAYQIIDGLVGELVDECASEDTIVVVVSDHGAVPAWKVVNVAAALVREGLLSYRWEPSLGKYVVDWRRTLAFPYYEPPYVWVNLKGREPHGVVSPSEYEEVRERVIEALYSIRDPETGQRVVELALRREDAAPLGLGGERDGDVVYFLRPPYEIFDGRLDQLNTAEVPPDLFARGEVYDAERAFCAHLYYLPTVSSREFTVKSTLIMKGPGVRKGVRLRRPVKLIDLAPTLAHLLGIPRPRDAEGRVIYEALE